MSNVWIVDPYSDFPEEGWRNGRYHSIAEKLCNSGFNVYLFISDFSHKEKKFINKQGVYLIKNNFNIVVLPSSSYIGHISYKRILYEKNFASQLAKNIYNLDLPQIFILKDPAIFMYSSLKPILTSSKAKLIIDIIDLWPELFELKLNKSIRFLGRLIFAYFYIKRNYIYSKASAFSAVATDYLDVPRLVNPLVPKTVVYWGCDNMFIKNEKNSADDNILNEFGLIKAKDEIWGIYAGTLGENYDILTLLKAASLLNLSHPNLKFVIAGAGPLESEVKRYTSTFSNIYFLGSIPTIKLYRLFKFCDFGFSTYAEASTVSMPIKCYDYFAAGLPIVNSLGRSLGQFVLDRNVGFLYDAGSCESLCKVLSYVSSNRNDLFAMSEACYLLGIEFNSDKQYEKFVNLCYLV